MAAENVEVPAYVAGRDPPQKLGAGPHLAGLTREKETTMTGWEVLLVILVMAVRLAVALVLLACFPVLMLILFLLRGFAFPVRQV